MRKQGEYEMTLYKLTYELTTLFIVTFIKTLPLCYLFTLWNSVIASVAHTLATTAFHSAKLTSFQFLNFKISRIKGKLTSHKNKFCFFPMLWISYTPEYLTHRRLRIMTQTLSISFSMMSYTLFCLLVYHVADRDFFRLYMWCTIFFAAYSLYKFFYLTISEIRNSPQMELLRKINYLLSLSMKGTPLSQLGDQLSEEINFSSKPTFNEYQYILYQYFYSPEKGDTERIRQLIYKMEKALPPLIA